MFVFIQFNLRWNNPLLRLFSKTCLQKQLYGGCDFIVFIRIPPSRNKKGTQLSLHPVLRYRQPVQQDAESSVHTGRIPFYLLRRTKNFAEFSEQNKVKTMQTNFHNIS